MCHPSGRISHRFHLARPAGLEPAAPGLEGRCSIRLSYGRVRASFGNEKRDTREYRTHPSSTITR